MSNPISSDFNFQNIININSYSDTVKDFAKVENKENSELKIDKIEENKKYNELQEAFSINYDEDGAPETVNDMIKDYTAKVSAKIASYEIPSENDTKDLSKAAYKYAGMSDYYSLQSVLDLSKAISAYGKSSANPLFLNSVSNFVINL